MQSCQKPPRNVAHGALVVWEGAEDDEEAKLATSGTLLKHFVRQEQNSNAIGVGDDYTPAEITISCLVWGHALDLGGNQSYHLLGQLNTVGTQHPAYIAAVAMDGFTFHELYT